MLRKTGHQRNSMKRANEPYEGGTATFNFREKNVVYRSGNARRAESPEWNPNEMIRMSEEYGRESLAFDVGRRGRDDDENITTELAPGIIVEGKVADL